MKKNVLFLVFVGVLFQLQVVAVQKDTAFFDAIDSEDFKLVREILENGDININEFKSYRGDETTPLFLAAETGSKKMVRELLKHPEINPNLGLRHYKYGQSPLKYAISKGYHKIVKELLKHPESDPNNDPNDRSGRQFSPLYDAISEYKHSAVPASYIDRLECIKLLLTHPEINPNKGYVSRCYDCTKLPKHIETPLYKAMCKNNLQVVQLLLNHPKINPNMGIRKIIANENTIVITPLLDAIRFEKKIEIILELLKHEKTDCSFGKYVIDKDGKMLPEHEILYSNEEIKKVLSPYKAIEEILGHKKVD
jgi:hypothetical protein